MTFRYITVSELVSLTTGHEYNSWKVVPISPARASSQAVNPYAVPGDIALIIAQDEKSGQILSYAGIYPSELNIGEPVRFAWNSCWWANETAGGDVSMRVFINFIKLWENRIAFSDMTEKTFRIVQSLGFCHTMKRDGFILTFRPGFVNRVKTYGHSKKKLSFLAKPIIYSGLAWLSDRVSNALLFLPYRLQSGTVDGNQPVTLNFPEERDFEFIRTHSRGNIHVPGAGELKMPSWLQKPSKQNIFLARKYYFSSFSYGFNVFWLRWEVKGQTKALGMLSLRDGVLKTLYIYYEEDFKNRFAAGLMSYCLKTSGVRVLLTAQPAISEYISGKNLFILSKRKFTRYSAVSKDLLKYFPGEPDLQDGDGDYRFT